MLLVVMAALSLCIHAGGSEGDSECQRQRSQTDGSAGEDQTEEPLRPTDHRILPLFRLIKCLSDTVPLRNKTSTLHVSKVNTTDINIWMFPSPTLQSQVCVIHQQLCICRHCVITWPPGEHISLRSFKAGVWQIPQAPSMKTCLSKHSIDCSSTFHYF